jgi:Cof subfamily protein (haloacid dehalogenase superfamily)
MGQAGVRAAMLRRSASVERRTGVKIQKGLENEGEERMNMKMIVTDIDDTLLKKDKTVSEYTLNTLSRCRESGIKTAIATARGHPEKVAPVEQFDGRILCNGAVIIADGATYRQTIPCQEARPLLLACCQRGLRITTQLDDMHYSNFDVDTVWPEIQKWKIVDFTTHDVDIEKINVESVTEEDAIFIRQYMTGNMYLKVARDGLGMIMHKDATKSKALAELARIWGIAQSEIVAFGDDLNDIDMLSYAGFGVAMGNALDEVKAVADYICDTNENDGVAKWLEENVL